jgi:hypothetical protein
VFRKPEVKRSLGRYIDGRIPLKQIIKEQDGIVFSGFIWLKKWTCDGRLQTM